MKHWIIFQIWRHRISAFSALLTMLFIFFWPSIPLGSIEKWLQFFYFYTPQNFFYSFVTLLTGLYAGTYVYNKKIISCCAIKNTKLGASGGILGMILGACPACIPALPFLLPLSATIFLSRLSLTFLIVSIGIMGFSLWKIGGFRSHHELTH